MDKSKKKGGLDLLQATTLIHLITPGQNGQGVPLCLWTDPGYGKNTMVKALWRHVSANPRGETAPIVESTLQGKHPSEVDGLAVLTEGGDTVDKRPFESYVAKGVLHLVDEVASAEEENQAAMQPVLSERKWGHIYCPEQVFVLLANPPKTATNPGQMTRAFANRMGHYWFEDAKADSTRLVSYFRSCEQKHRKGLPVNGLDLEFHNFWDTVQQTQLVWKSHIAEAYKVAADFLELEPEAKQLGAPVDGWGEITDPRCYAYASPRSWENFIRVKAMLTALEAGLDNLFPVELLDGTGIDTVEEWFLRGILGAQVLDRWRFYNGALSSEILAYLREETSREPDVEPEQAATVAEICLRYPKSERAARMLIDLHSLAPDAVKEHHKRWHDEGGLSLESLMSPAERMLYLNRYRKGNK